MEKKSLFGFFLLFLLLVIPLSVVYQQSSAIAMLNPKGLIALKERNLMFIALSLMLTVVIPVFILTIFISWKYQANRKKAKYTPDWDNHLLIETIWWGFPLAIIVILSIITWNSSKELDPYKPLDATKEALVIQVVALDWKWLFIYPEQNIAAVNFVQFPEQTPIRFEITSDAPMNSFWIPQLGGQIYAMPGMKTQLHLIANEEGNFRGSSANLSGRGFSGMTFTAKSSSQADFDRWVDAIAKSSTSLNLKEYALLAKPSEYHRIVTYSLEDKNLFDWILMKPSRPLSENRFFHMKK